MMEVLLVYTLNASCLDLDIYTYLCLLWNALGKYHGTGGRMRVEKTRQSYMTSYFLNAIKEKGYKIRDPNAEQTEGIYIYKCTT
jgi:hypothetical protein